MQKYTFVFIAMTVVFRASLAKPQGSGADERKCEGACPIAYKCSSEEKVVWTLEEGHNCQVWRNECHLKSANCQRVNNCQKELELVSKEKCQPQCRDICLQVYQPVCGYYNEEKRTFSNSCTMQAHRCCTGETWDTFGGGEC